ncbi:hypothetical protein [Phyllobacterium ifriqiyense]|uniref:hypothetical protein n=1 Tax=Phyllobacterium ifriqiyense TaxID=314238 RepID=UPI0033942E69
MVVGIAEGYGALKAALEIVKGLKDVNDQVKLNAAVIELQSKILDAQEATSGAKDRLKELETEIAELKAWDKQAARYQLKDFGEQTYAYELKAASSNGEPAHLVCPTCYQKKVRSILQFQHTYGGRRSFKCYECTNTIELGRYEVEQAYISDDSNPWVV